MPQKTETETLPEQRQSRRKIALPNIPRRRRRAASPAPASRRKRIPGWAILAIIAVVVVVGVLAVELFRQMGIHG